MTLKCEYKTEQEYIEIVKKCGMALKYIEKQTEEICIAALLQNIEAKQHINKPREEIIKMISNVIAKKSMEISAMTQLISKI
jgi:methionine salvage enolase-phosphatase E1